MEQMIELKLKKMSLDYCEFEEPSSSSDETEVNLETPVQLSTQGVFTVHYFEIIDYVNISSIHKMLGLYTDRMR